MEYFLRPRQGRPVDFYTRVKIRDPIYPGPNKRKYLKKKTLSELDFLKSQLRFLIIRELKKASDGFCTLSLPISFEIENFLKNTHNLKKKWVDGSRFLNSDLKIPNIIRKAPDTIPNIVTNFQMRFGNSRKQKYWSGVDLNDQEGI